MPINRETFDADLSAFTTATTEYIAAVDAFIALPPVIDLANEDQTVQDALTAVNAAKERIPHPTKPS